ncbi:MAG: hypothetical protein HUU10_07490 [Bacteroidetes bacterium]|nr:hypothetical protein [Bacteroidota bacterium]
MKSFSRFFIPSIFILSVSVAFTGCDNPAHDDEDHAEAEGLILKESTGSKTELVRVWNGAVQSGSLNVVAGTETDHIEIFFLDENQKPFQPEGSEYTLTWTVADTSVAEVEQHDHLSKVSAEKWEFVLVGKKAGSTKVQFSLNHGGHADFRTPEVTSPTAIGINVTAPGK